MTELEAANRALMFLGVEQIASLNDDGKPARVMRELLPSTKKLVLTEFPWSFATRITALAPAYAAAPEGFGKSFAYPSGALAVRKVYEGTAHKRFTEFSVFEISGVRYVAAQLESGNIEYVENIDSVALWPEQAAECLAARLASDAAVTLDGSPELSVSMMQKYAILAQNAAQTSVVERQFYPARASHYIDVRR
jgi:hypothetical protein